jgi:hypothetical protein
LTRWLIAHDVLERENLLMGLETNPPAFVSASLFLENIQKSFTMRLMLQRKKENRN